MALSPDAAAAAAVAALFFVATLCAPVNFRLTGRGFKLYIPLGLSTAFRGIAHAARASFMVEPNPNLIAVYGALNAVGFGIAVAMCCCFMVIWLRNALHYQSPPAAKLLSGAGRLLVGAVIAFGPVLGVVGVILVYGAHGDKEALLHGQHVRVASSAGFTSVTALATIMSAYLTLTRLLRSRKAAAAAAAMTAAVTAASSGAKVMQPSPLTAAAEGDTSPPNKASAPHPTLAAAAALSEEGGTEEDSSSHSSHHQQQQQQQQRQRQQDGLIVVLWGCLLLLCWCAASRLASFYHPSVTSTTPLYYAASVLPELLVAFVFAAPTLAARVALGGRYSDWLQQQQGGKPSSGSSSSAAGAVDAEVGVEAEGGVEMFGGKAVGTGP